MASFRKARPDYDHSGNACKLDSCILINYHFWNVPNHQPIFAFCVPKRFRPQEAGFLQVVDIYYQEARGWSAAWLFGLAAVSLSRRGCSFVL
jgi:hypothetical protein